MRATSEPRADRTFADIELDEETTRAANRSPLAHHLAALASQINAGTVLSKPKTFISPHATTSLGRCQRREVHVSYCAVTLGKCCAAVGYVSSLIPW